MWNGGWALLLCALVLEAELNKLKYNVLYLGGEMDSSSCSGWQPTFFQCCLPEHCSCMF